LVGITALLGVLISTWWVPSFHITLLAGDPGCCSSYCAIWHGEECGMRRRKNQQLVEFLK